MKLRSESLITNTPPPPPPEPIPIRANKSSHLSVNISSRPRFSSPCSAVFFALLITNVSLGRHVLTLWFWQQGRKESLRWWWSRPAYREGGTLNVGIPDQTVLSSPLRVLWVPPEGTWARGARTGTAGKEEGWGKRENNTGGDQDMKKVKNMWDCWPSEMTGVAGVQEVRGSKIW